MGKASRIKQQKRMQAQAHRRDRPALIQKLREQVTLLSVLGKEFDGGQRVVALPLATVIRVLVHDTAQSHALLAQLGELSKMQLLDTSLPIDPSNLLKAHAGLALMRMTMGTGSEWVPRTEVPVLSPNAQPRDVPFHVWWNTDVTSDSDGTLWSRKKMVMSIANKEGGAHIDPEQPLDLRAIEEENSMGWSYRDPIVGDQPMSNGPLLPSIRQIAYELETSITRQLASELGT